MNSTPCLNCRQEKGPFVELRCEHSLCLQCADKIKIPEGLPPLDAKFRICCPTCKTNTITINIQNIINRENQQQMLFVNMESSQLSQEEFQQPYNQGTGKLSESKLRKMSYTERRSNIYAQRKTPQVSERNSKASHDSHNHRAVNSKSRQGDNIFEVKCNIHKQALMFYCQQQSLVMCMQCMYKHMKEQKNHNVCSISDAVGVINRQNLQSKSQTKKKIEEVEKNLAICKGNKSRIEQAFEIHEQLICQQFKELQKLIKKKQNENREYLQKVFKKKQQQITEQIKELNYIKTCLKQHYQFTLDNSSSQIYFFNAYNLLKGAISKYSINYKQIKKEQFVCFDKLASLQDFSTLLQKFYRPKNDGRESKTMRKQQSNAPSRASEKAQQNKIKQQFYEEAKKKLQRLNKMQSQHHQNHNSKKKNGQEYLNNFFIQQAQIKKQLQNNNGEKIPGSVISTYRKSSASQYVDKKIIHKTLTPTRISVNQSTTAKPKKK